MTYDPDRFDEALERLLEEDPSQRAGQEPDPLLQLSLQLRDRLEPTSPDPWFRARLKAELLQKAADNVRPFPIAARLADASSVSRWHRARRAVVALAVAGAASIGLAVGYSGLHQETRPHHTVALLAPPTASATAVLAAPTATPAPVQTARVATPRHGSNHSGDPGSTDTPPTYRVHVPRRLPSDTPVIATPAPRIVANNINPTRTLLTRTPLPAASPTVTARTTMAPTATSGHVNPTAAVHVTFTATPVDTTAPTSTPRPTATHTAVTMRPTATHVAANPRPTAARVAATQHLVVTSPTRVPPSSTATAATHVNANTTPRSSTPARQSPTATPEPDSPTVAPSDTPSPTAARPRPSATTARPSATTARPVATTARPSPTPVPTRTSHEARVTATPRYGVSHAATVIVATATVAPASATEMPALATATASPTQPESSSTPAPSATAASTATVAPTSTATQEPATVAPTVIPAPSGTPPPATATAIPSPTAGPPLVAQVTASATAGGILNSAAHAAGSPTVVVLAANQFPAPSQLNAAPDSPLAHTTPFTPGVLLRLPAAFAPDPVSLAVYKPASAQQSPLEQLRVFGLQPSKVLSDTRMRAVAIVSADSRFYRADYQSRSTGFRLRLALLTAVPPSAPQPPSFDAASSARTFLGAHQLAGDGQQLDAVTTLADGTKVAHFSEYAPDQIVGARATISFNTRGVLVAADIQWVFTSVAPLEPAISSAAAFDSVAAGNGFVNASGALPDGTSTITGTTILYLPVTAPDGTYYEPVYRLSGLTATGSAFQVYVSALDRAYLR